MKRFGYMLLAGVLVACGDRAKDPGLTYLFVSEVTAGKVSGGGSARVGQTQTVMVNDRVAKSVSALVAGQAAQGSLSSADPMLDNGAHFDVWEFQLKQESDVTVTLVSATFDTHLTLMEGSLAAPGEILGANDDADGTNSALWGTLAAGPYVAIASSYAGGMTGDYAIALTATGTGSGGVRVLEPGRPGSGTLSSSDPTRPDPAAYYQEWSFYGNAGDQVTLSLSSGEFDTLLGLVMDGSVLAMNDDSQGTTNSQISMYLPWSGMYTAVVSSYLAATTGAYSLSMASVPRAPFAGFGGGGDPNGRYALLVGIADYPGDEDDLVGPDEDARIMQRLLVERFGFDPANIVTLQSEDATRANIAQGIAQHLGQAGPNGVAVLYYSGHGAQVGANIGITGSVDVEPSGQDQALVVYGGAGDISSAILDEELGFLIESLDAGRTLLIADACFSGSATRGAAQSRSIDLSDPETAARVRLPRTFITSELRALNISDLSLGFGDLGRIARVLDQPQRHLMWSAATDEQQSWTSIEYRTGAFTTILDRRLRSEPGTSTFAQVHQLVHDEVVRHTGNHPSGQMELQNPQLRGDRQSMTIDEFFRQR